MYDRLVGSLQSILVLVGLLAVEVSAGIRCDFKSLAKDCEKFRSNGPLFEMHPDGTLIPNPVATARLSRDVRTRNLNMSEDPELLKKRAELTLNVRQLITLRTSSLEISQAAKDAISEMANDLVKNLYHQPSPIIMVPDSVKSDRPTLKAVPFDMLPDFFESVGGADFRTNFSREIMQYAAAWRQLNEGFTKEEIQELGPLFQPPHPSRVEALFSKVQQLVVEEIRAGRLDSDLSEAEKVAIRRVQTTKIFDPRHLSAAHLIQTRCNQAMGQNAAYMHNYHAIVVCPGVARMSDEALMEVLGHELAHPIAPCASQFGIYEVNEEAVQSLRKSAPLHIPFKKSTDKERATLFDMISASKKPSNFILGSFLLRVPIEIVREFQEKGLIKIVTQGIDAKAYPFSKLSRCLSESSGIRTDTEKEIIEYVDQVVRERQKMMGDAYNAESDRSAMTKSLTTYSGCFSPNGDPQVEEAFPNWMGVRVLGRAMKAKGSAYSADQLHRAIGWKIGLVCKAREMASRVENASSQAATAAEAKKTVERAEDAHPYEKTHLENFILADPNVRTALGCEKDERAPLCSWNPYATQNGSPSKGTGL